MRSSPHQILVLCAILGLVWGNPARSSRQLEEGSGDDLPDTSMTDNVEGAPDDDSKVKISQDSESETSNAGNLDESQNEVKVDGPTEDEKLVEAEKKDNEKCKKCLKPSWRGRHASICESCEKKGVIKPIDREDEKQIEKCKKCTRRKFKARHGIFCSECPVSELYEEEKNVKSEHKKHKKDTPKKSNLVKSKHEIESDEEEEEGKTEDGSMDTRKKEHKNKNKKHGNQDKSKKKEVTENKEEVKNKNKNHNHNHKNKNNKNKNNKNKNKNKNNVKDEPKKESYGTKFATTFVEVKDKKKPEPAKANLGPLGSLIKYLVESNTFTK
eukprot:TRINITY_DN4101_c0_g1_i1.p1 TRINITY_DN4101_c0_g1~~TRINITY_DN4101_c0_g1_i1.p1  ORF type:complete len:326 (-),score=93.06 TRINITY_DN4101_c0_g1_i1:173-1150(-)